MTIFTYKNVTLLYLKKMILLIEYEKKVTFLHFKIK